MTELRTRRSLVGYVIVGTLAVTIGAAGTFVVMRQRIARPIVTTGPAPTTPAAVPDGEGVYISPARQQMIGVRTAAVTSRDLTSTIRSTGTLAYDETGVTEVHTKIAGWIDKLFVDFVGKPVHKGQALFTIYSPELVSTQNEYLLARKAQGQLANSQFEETRQGAASLLAAARTRLSLWDISPAQIANLERTGEPQKTLTLYALGTGVVLERNAFSGQYVTPEMSLFKIADLSTIWAVGELFESDLAQVRIGQSVTIELSNAPGTRPLTGRITFVYPAVDPATRRVRIRVEIANRALTLKPDTFVTLTIQGAASRLLAIPGEALIDTGVKQYVILARENGYFGPQIVRVGTMVGDYYPVLEGLTEGDRVVTSAQFLVDSETNLQAAMQSMAEMPGMTSSGSPTTAPVALEIAVETRPAPPRPGENSLAVTVKDAQGQPVIDLTLVMNFFMAGMPSMNMPAMRAAVTLSHAGNGVYRGMVDVPTAGRWDMTVTVSRGGQRIGGKRLALVVR